MTKKQVEDLMERLLVRNVGESPDINVSTMALLENELLLQSFIDALKALSILYKSITEEENTH